MVSRFRWKPIAWSPCVAGLFWKRYDEDLLTHHGLLRFRAMIEEA